ncbi:MAG: ketol-acid reductoisomerase [Planctomycetota bacterium]
MRPELLRGRRIAVVGYGSQGRAQALNLHDSGCDVVVGLRAGSAARAAADGLRVADIAKAVGSTADGAGAANIVMLLIPDEQQPEAYATLIEPHLRPGAYLGFAHGFAIHFRRLVPGPQINVFMVAPKGIGPMVRRQYEAGGGVPALVAVHQDPSGDTRAVALAYAAAIGCGRAGVFETTFREETETDLFSEQAVLCGGLTALIRAGFETLVAAGYAPEVAYFECLHEVKLIAELIHARGIAGMRAMISNTAKYGDVTRGPRVIGPAVRDAMRAVLDDVRSGRFAEEWMAEYAAGSANLRRLLEQDAAHPIEDVGRRLRALMPWLENEKSRPG